MRLKSSVVGYALVLLMIIGVPFTLCSCDFIDGFFNEEVESISLSETDISLTVGDSKVLEAQVQPDDASNKTLVWTSTDNEIAAVENGTVTAKKAGSAVVSVESDNGVSKSCNVTVLDKEIEKITLSDETASLREGQTIQIEASVTPLDAKTDSLAWSSDSDDIAKVNSSGYVTGVSVGVANIVCKASNGVEASCTVTVRASVSATESATLPSSSTESTTSASEKSETKSSNSSSRTSSSSSRSSVSSGTAYSGCIFPDSSLRRLTESEVSMLSESEAQQAINEIYARNGHIFNTESIQKYFEAQSWYVPIGKVSVSDMSEIEQYNISLLQKYR